MKQISLPCFTSLPGLFASFLSWQIEQSPAAKGAWVQAAFSFEGSGACRGGAAGAALGLGAGAGAACAAAASASKATASRDREWKWFTRPPA
jgi:hypothetical protein